MLPSKHVFSIPELFEAILSHVDIGTLLLSTRVSQRWKSTIQESSILQQKLFFAPVMQTSPIVQNHNPLLKSLFPPFFYPRAALTQATNWYQFNSSCLRSLPWFNTFKKQAVLRKDASWRKMYPVQRPAPITRINDTSMHCDIDHLDEVAHISASSTLVDENGCVKMGLLYEAVIECFDEETCDGGVSIEWMMFEEKEDFEKSEEKEESSRLIDGRKRERRQTANAIEVRVQWYKQCSDPQKGNWRGLEIVEGEAPNVLEWET